MPPWAFTLAQAVGGFDLPELVGGAGLIALVVAAAVRVLTQDRDESAVIQAWKDAAAHARTQTEEAEARAARLDAHNRDLRRENERLRRRLNDLGHDPDGDTATVESHEPPSSGGWGGGWRG